MRRNRRNNGKRERIVMIASSVFVLGAMTLTGVYMQSKNAESQDDGYTIDFSALENNTSSKSREIAQNQQKEEHPDEFQAGTAGQTGPVNPTMESGLNLDDDLDYMPLEAGSSLIEIPGLTEGISEENEEPAVMEEPEPPVETKEAVTEKVVVTKDLHFAEADGLLRPLEGEVLLPFSMDGGIFFSTLELYKYNPALMIQAQEGETVVACAEGKVTDIFEDAEIGHAVAMELGDGYQLIYGQLQEINVSLGSYVSEGEVVGKVAAPTKYFSVEGANLYLKLTADGVPVNPEKLFR